MDDAYYLARLYPFQDRVLSVIGDNGTGFYLTGGTAASRGFLNHRFSDDLDLFVNDDPQFALWTERIIASLAAVDDWRTEVNLRDERFVRLLLVQPEITLKVEMVNDVPNRVGRVTEHPVLGRLDTPENILANKISALIDRQEPKDLADIWGFCSRLGLSIHEALEGARGKAAGLFPADVARLVLTASEDDWQVIRWYEGPTTDQFLADLRELGESLLLVG
jgi:Nucleotidyl transferase AbiEii toxin, Type IV TA system